MNRNSVREALRHQLPGGYGCRFDYWELRAQRICQIQSIEAFAVPMTSEVRRGTEASREGEGLEQLSSGHGATSRIRTEASGPAQKRMHAGPSTPIRPHLLRHLCQGQASFERRVGGSDGAVMPFRAYHRPMII